MKKWRKIVSLLTAIIIAVMVPLNAMAATGSKYIKEVRISQAAKAEDAKAWLKNNGYTILDQNLNDGTGKDCVYLGYKTTTNRDEAITDMAIMDMKGGYSFGEYENMLKQREMEIKSTLHYFQATVKEFTANYKNGNASAVSAVELMNRFYEDDSGLRLGNFLTTYVDDADQLTKLFMQSNSSVISFMFYLLALGCTDSSETGNWLYKFSQADPYDYYDPIDYDETARSLFVHWDELREQLLGYDRAVEIIENYGSAEEFAENATLEEISTTTEILTLHDILDSYEYDGESMLEFFLRDPDEIDISELYPLASVMTVGQTECARYIGLKQLVKLAVSTEETLKNYEEAFESLTSLTGSTVAYSVYFGIDRSLFEGGVALTNDALRESASNADNSWISGNIDKKVEMAFHIIAGSTFLAGGVLAASFGGVTAYSKIMLSALYKTCNSIGNINAITDPVKLAWIDSLGVQEEALLATSSRFASLAGKVLIVAFGVALLIEAVLLGIQIYNYYHPEYTEIPRILVDQKEDKDGNYIYANYYATLDQDGRYADLNAWSGKQWNALYTSKDKNLGEPITVELLVRKGSGADQSDYFAVHYFGASNAFDLNTHCYKDKVSGIYMFAKREKASLLTGSVFAEGNIVGIGMGILVGTLLGVAVACSVEKIKERKRCSL